MKMGLLLTFIYITGSLAVLKMPLASAMLPPKPHSLGEFISAGKIVGGEAQGLMSLLRVQRLEGSGGVEKVILTYGDADGVPLSTKPGFFQLSIDHSSQRISLDLAKVTKTAVDVRDLAHALDGSALLSESEIVSDPEDNSMTLIFKSRQAVEVRAYIDSDQDKINQLVLEFRVTSSGSNTKLKSKDVSPRGGA